MKSKPTFKTVASIAVATIFHCASTVAQKPELSPKVPCDIGDLQPQLKQRFPSVQDQIDNLSWQTFVALNSPGGGGRIGKAPADQRVWEGDAFVDPEVLFKLAGKSKEKAKLIKRVGKTPVRVTPEVFQDPGIDLQAATGAPVIDQYGNYVVSEIRINKSAADYFRSEKLLSEPDLIAYAVEAREKGKRAILDFPAGDSKQGEVGAINIKAAWRVFPEATTEGEKSRYHWRTAEIHVPGTKDTIIEADVGLVGFHIAHKTKNHDRWLWATFEHIDNAPPASDEEAAKRKIPCTFNNGKTPNDETDNIEPKAQIPFPWGTKTPFAANIPGNPPVNVTHCTNEVAPPKEINLLWQAALDGTCWKYYMLNATQWYDETAKQPMPQNSDKVSIVRNSLLETYLLSWTKTKTESAVPPSEIKTSHSLDPSAIAANSNISLLSDYGSEQWVKNFDEILFGQLIPATQPSAQARPADAPPNSKRLAWSSCMLCHQMARWQKKVDAETFTIYGDESFVLSTFFPSH